MKAKQVIRRTKIPYFHQLPIIAKNLAKKFNCTVFCRIEEVFYRDIDGKFRSTHTLSFVPGFSEDCTQFSFKTWPELQDKYFELMKGSN